MVVEVRLYAILRKYCSQNSNGLLTVEIPEGTTAGELIEMLDINNDDIKLVMVNGKHAELNVQLTDSDRIGLFPPVGGG